MKTLPAFFPPKNQVNLLLMAKKIRWNWLRVVLFPVADQGFPGAFAGSLAISISSFAAHLPDLWPHKMKCILKKSSHFMSRNIISNLPKPRTISFQKSPTPTPTVAPNIGPPNFHPHWVGTPTFPIQLHQRGGLPVVSKPPAGGRLQVAWWLQALYVYMERGPMPGDRQGCGPPIPTWAPVMGNPYIYI